MHSKANMYLFYCAPYAVHLFAMQQRTITTRAVMHCTVGQTAAIIESYIFVWSYKGSKTDSKNVVKLVVSLFTVHKIKFKNTNFGPLPKNG